MDEKGLGKRKMRIILAIFIDRFEVYGSLKPFFEQYPQYAEMRYISMACKSFNNILTYFNLNIM